MGASSESSLLFASVGGEITLDSLHSDKEQPPVEGGVKMEEYRVPEPETEDKTEQDENSILKHLFENEGVSRAF